MKRGINVEINVENIEELKALLKDAGELTAQLEKKIEEISSLTLKINAKINQLPESTDN